MAPKRPKSWRRRRRNEDVIQSPEKPDCLLELPEPVLHQILSRVSTAEAARMSVLSKRWRRVWRRLPGLYFTDNTATPREFCGAVRTCLRLRDADILGVATKTPVLSFRLEMTQSWRWKTVDKWLRFVSNGRLRELDVSLKNRNKKSFRLPCDLLHITSLTRVGLTGVDIMGLDFVKLRFLSSLSLDTVKLDDKTLQSLLSRCDSLAKLRVNRCSGLKEPRISSPKLKCLEVGLSAESAKFTVEAPGLESFVCRGLFASLESSFPLNATLRNLVLADSLFDDLWLEDLIFMLPFLESLALQNCPGLNSVKIDGPSLRHLTFCGNGVGGNAEAKVDSPGLVYFCYRGYLQPGFSINPENLSEANVRLYNRTNCGDDWHAGLVKFLSSLNCSDTLSLDVHSEEVLTFPMDLRVKFASPLPKLKHMKVRTKVTPWNSSKFEKVLNWVSPSLETLSITKR